MYNDKIIKLRQAHRALAFYDENIVKGEIFSYERIDIIFEKNYNNK